MTPSDDEAPDTEREPETLRCPPSAPHTDREVSLEVVNG